MIEPSPDTFSIIDGVPYVGLKAFPWAKEVRHINFAEEIDKDPELWGDLGKRFSRHAQRGFHLLLENGWTLSVQWGSHNYCSNYIVRLLEDEEEYVFHEACPTAEIAAWDKEGNWYQWHSETNEFCNARAGEACNCDTVEGYVTPDFVLAFLDQLMSFPSEVDPRFLHNMQDVKERLSSAIEQLGEKFENEHET